MIASKVSSNLRGSVDDNILIADDKLVDGLNPHCLILEGVFATELSDGPFLADHNTVDVHRHFRVVSKLQLSNNVEGIEYKF